MKITRLLGNLALTCLVAFAARAADFEGTLKWSIAVEITDPEMKAQMNESRQQMADPAKRAEMQAMLADPEMKAAMEQNPQMKAMMEAQLKAADDAAAGKEGGDMFSSMMPKAMTVRTKAGKSHLVSEGGAMPMEVISTTEPPVSYWIDRKAGTFSKLPADTGTKTGSEPKPTVTKGTRTTKILGYTCEEYIVEMKADGSKLRGVLWATDDIEGLDGKALAKARFGGQDADYFSQVDGVPLKMEMTLPEMKMTMTATAVTPGKVPDSTFEIPAGFQEKPFAAASSAAPKTN